MIKFDLTYIGPTDVIGTYYAFLANSPEEAISQAPYWLAACSQWRPDQFKIISAKISIYEDLTCRT